MPSHIRSNGELNLELIFNELRNINNSLDDDAAERMSREVIGCRGKIVGLGAGRMGYSLQAFIMRLSHLGYIAYMLGDTSVPRIGVGDLVLVNSSSGETPSVCLLAEIAKKKWRQGYFVDVRTWIDPCKVSRRSHPLQENAVSTVNENIV